jgi:hypothetical protein
MSACTCHRARSPQRLFHLVLGSHDGTAWCRFRREACASDLDTVMADGLKALDLSRPIREADMVAVRLGVTKGTPQSKICDIYFQKTRAKPRGGTAPQVHGR